MAKTDINENIYRAIDTIIDARLQNLIPALSTVYIPE